MSSTPFNISEATEFADGVLRRDIQFPEGPAHGRAFVIDLPRVQLEVLLFYELVNRSFCPGWGYTLPSNVSSGINLPQLFERHRLEAKRISACVLDRCIIACNTIHTNFVRGNGFVITNGALIVKPPGAVALDGNTYEPLYGRYHALILSPDAPRVRELTIQNNVLVDPDPPELALSGPPIVEAGANVASRIQWRPPALGQTINEEVNFPPTKHASSFTVFGVTKDKKFVTLSMFAGNDWKEEVESNCRYFRSEREHGITLETMADLLIELEADHGIAGGGAADTQQFVSGEQIWAGEPTSRDVDGLRGLGAILCVLAPEPRGEAT